MNFDFPVIDAHVHLYPDALAKKVTPSLGAKFGNEPAFDGTVEGCKKAAFSGGIAASINQPVATEPRQVEHTNGFWRNHISGKPLSCGGESQVFSLACFHPLCENKKQGIETIKAAGFAGIKFHPEYQKFRLNDSEMDDIWSAMSDNDLVAFLHAGGERVFKPPFHSTPSEIAELNDRFPALKIAAAHLGGFEMWDEAEEFLMGRDIYLDLSHTFFWMDDEQILRMIRNHGAERIIFGSDAPWQDATKVLQALFSLPLEYEEFKKICCTNAARLFGLALAD